MTTRAEEIAAEGPYKVKSFHRLSHFVMMGDVEIDWFQTERQATAFANQLNSAHANGYKQGQQDRWIPVSQFKAPAPGQTILFGSKNTVRMWTWDANNDEPPSSWATHYRLIELPHNPEQP